MQILVFCEHEELLFQSLLFHPLKKCCHDSGKTRFGVSEPVGGSSPRFASVATENLWYSRGSPLGLTCLAQGSPPPSFR